MNKLLLDRKFSIEIKTFLMKLSGDTIWCVMWCYPLGLITSLRSPLTQLSILKLHSLIHVPTYSLPPPSSAYLRAPSGSQEYKFQFAEHSRQNSIISSTPSATERSWCTAVTTQLLLIVLVPDTFSCSLASPH